MRLFFDSSAIVKRYRAEPSSAAVESFWQNSEVLGICTITMTEVIAALNRAVREKALSLQQYGAAKLAFDSDIAECEMVGLQSGVILRAIRVLEMWPLRSADAIQVASAQLWGADVFLSADRRQCAAARGAGLKVEELPALL